MGEFDIRWKQRFQNFDRAFVLLRSAFEENDIEKLSMLEQEGVIQRFEYTYELAWKTLKDYLQDNGNTILPEVTARAVFKEAFSAGIIKDGQVFIDMMLSRNLLSHCYDFAKFKEIIQLTKVQYLPALSNLHEFFIERVMA
ncbi:MAG: nucleotidyltransferase substrate binding protein [Hyphomonadaceae bacterium]|nr:nucleotidyltransferase substrate binding protein [Clostridia bacterium]